MLLNIRFYFIVIFLSFFSEIAFSMPKKVILVRHAEKNEEVRKYSSENWQSLAPKGYNRAHAYTQYFPFNFGVIDYVFAVKPDADYQSYRTIETCSPTAFNLKPQGETFNINYNLDKTKELAKGILSEKKYDNKTILICWEHKHINLLAGALGADKKKLKKWPGDVFDVTYEFIFNGNSLKQFNIKPQKLMYGDSDKLF